MKSEKLKIEAKIIHPEVCQFSFSEKIFSDINFLADSKEKAKGSWFLESFFNISGIGEISIFNNIIRVKRQGTKAWSELGKEVGSFIRSSFDTGLPFFSEDFFATKKDLSLKQDSELWKKIDAILLAQVSPSLAAHGGKVSIVDYKDGVLYLNFAGGCQGCSQISATLKGGIETILKKEIEGLKEIVDVTDHNSGDTPYFK